MSYYIPGLSSSIEKDAVYQEILTDIEHLKPLLESYIFWLEKHKNETYSDFTSDTDILITDLDTIVAKLLNV